MENASTLYTVGTFSHTLEIFGEPDMGWYGWALIRSDRTVAATDEDQQYGSFHTALREGLEAAQQLEG